MQKDLAWPNLRDFFHGGAFREYGLRVLDGVFCGGLALAAYWYSAQWPTPGPESGPAPQWLVSLWRLPAFGSLLVLPAVLFGFVAFPSRFRLGHKPQLSWSRICAPPEARTRDSTICPVAEGPDWNTVALALLLAAFSGPLANLALWIPAMPFLIFRLFSRLWTELNLVQGQVFYHRTFLGLTLTRPGPDLQKMEAVISGDRCHGPDESPRYSVVLVTDGWHLIPVNSHHQSPEQAHAAGSALAAALDLPHHRLQPGPLPRLPDTYGFSELPPAPPLWSAIHDPVSYPRTRPRLPE